MVRSGIFTLEEVFGNISKEKYATVRMGSQRYKLFKEKGVKCVRCGIKGIYFARERQLRTRSKCVRPHFNLYAIKNGKEILMTKDHIIPKSKGGENHQDNYQPMCAPCNQKKGDSVESNQKL